MSPYQRPGRHHANNRAFGQSFEDFYTCCNQEFVFSLTFYFTIFLYIIFIYDYILFLFFIFPIDLQLGVGSILAVTKKKGE